jgi:hypothetical protein
LGKVGFVHRRSAGIEMFLDGPAAKARDAVYVIFSGEKVRPEYLSAVPDVADSVSFKSFRVLALEAVVQMKLTSYRDKDKTHVRDSPRGLGPNQPRNAPQSWITAGVTMAGAHSFRDRRCHGRPLKW